MREAKGPLSKRYPIRFSNELNVDDTGFRWFDIRAFSAEPRLVVSSV